MNMPIEIRVHTNEFFNIDSLQERFQWAMVTIGSMTSVTLGRITEWDKYIFLLSFCRRSHIPHILFHYHIHCICKLENMNLSPLRQELTENISTYPLQLQQEKELGGFL